VTLVKLRRGRYSLVGEKIPKDSPAVGKKIGDFALPRRAVIAAILRRGEIVMPEPEVKLEVGDEILAIVDPDVRDDLARLFTHRR
jgi:trk system potassium uptake protein TrkA